MGRKDNFIKNIVSCLEGMDDEYLIALSNKGIFNRALKDLSGCESLNINIGEDFIECTLPDGNVCALHEDIRGYKCTCPSRSFCKHAVMSYVYLRNNRDNIFKNCSSEADKHIENINENKFEWLQKISFDELKKTTGERAFADILRRIKFGVPVTIEEGKLITVKFTEEHISVRLMEEINNSVCSCKSPDFCRHKAEAILHYKLYKGFIKQEDIEKLHYKLSEDDKKSITETLGEIRKLIEEILLLGLSRLPLNVEDRLQQSAVICHNSDLPNLEKDMREIQEEIVLYLNKNVSFSRKKLKNKLTEIYNTSLSIENTEDFEKLTSLAGEHKTSYYEIPPIELYGAGAEGWKSGSGFQGITYYFINAKLKKWFTFTNALPTYYEGVKGNIKELYKANAPWGLNCSGQELSRSYIRLLGGKINTSFRISSSEQCRGTLIGASDISGLELSGLLFDDWLLLLKHIIDEDYKSNENYNVVLIKIKEYGKSSFDNINQIFTLPIYDKQERKISIRLEYSPDKKLLIERLESIEKHKNINMFLGRVYIASNQLNFVPFSAFCKDGSILNLTLD